MMTIRQIKTFAKRQLKGNLLAAIGAMILSFICSLLWVTALVAAVMFGVVGPLSGHVIMDAISYDPRMRLMFFAGTGIVIAALLFIGLYLYFGLMLGSQMLYINIAKGKRVSAFDIFKGFSNGAHLRHYFGVILILYFIELILMIPETYIGVRYGFSSRDYNITSYITSFLVFIVMMFLCMSGYASADHPDMKAAKAIAVSAHLMRNRKMKMLGFALSFIGWFLLGICTGGLLFFWVIPYFNTAYTIFYLSAYGQDYQSRIQDADYKEASPKDTYVRGDARPEGEAANASVSGLGSEKTDDANVSDNETPCNEESRKSFEEVRSQYTDIKTEAPKESIEEKELKKSYKTEEDAFAAYEQWKRDHGITIENQDPFHNPNENSSNNVVNNDNMEGEV